MSNAAAIETLMKRLQDYERKANALIEVVNDLRAEDGLPPLPPYGSGPSSSPSNATGSAAGSIGSIKPDTFYGKKLQTAIREYLEMRKTANLGPAKPREIFDAITAGGFQFETKDENVALVGLRALLRKRTAFFHKLPNGTYGLTVWYPDARKPKTAATSAERDEDDDAAEEPASNGATKQTAARPKGTAAA